MVHAQLPIGVVEALAGPQVEALVHRQATVEPRRITDQPAAQHVRTPSTGRRCRANSSPVRRRNTATAAVRHQCRRHLHHRRGSRTFGGVLDRQASRAASRSGRHHRGLVIAPCPAGALRLRPRISATWTIAVGLLGVARRSRTRQCARGRRGSRPLAAVALDVAGHVGLQLGADAEARRPITTRRTKSMPPGSLRCQVAVRSRRSAVRTYHIEVARSMEPDQRRLVEVLGQQLGVCRAHAAVAADVEVPAPLGGDDPDVLALGLGALAARSPTRRA